MLMLYLMDGMPACAQLRMRIWTASMSRSRSGLWASMMAGCFSRVDETGGEQGRVGAVDGDFVLRGEVDHGVEFVDGGVEAVAGDLRVAADVADAVAGEVLEVSVVGGGGLVA